MQQIARVTFAMSYATIPYIIARSIEAIVRGEPQPNQIVYVPQKPETIEHANTATKSPNAQSIGEWRIDPITGRKPEIVKREEIKGKWGD